jgi:hypothetical protein
MRAVAVSYKKSQAPGLVNSSFGVLFAAAAGRLGLPTFEVASKAE